MVAGSCERDLIKLRLNCRRIEMGFHQIFHRNADCYLDTGRRANVRTHASTNTHAQVSTLSCVSQSGLGSYVSLPWPHVPSRDTFLRASDLMYIRAHNTHVPFTHCVSKLTQLALYRNNMVGKSWEEFCFMSGGHAERLGRARELDWLRERELQIVWNALWVRRSDLCPWAAAASWVGCSRPSRPIRDRGTEICFPAVAHCCPNFFFLLLLSVFLSLSFSFFPFSFLSFPFYLFQGLAECSKYFPHTTRKKVTYQIVWRNMFFVVNVCLALFLMLGLFYLFLRFISRLLSCLPLSCRIESNASLVKCVCLDRNPETMRVFLLQTSL